MDLVIVPVLTALTTPALRGMAIEELLARLRWQYRHQQRQHSHLAAIPRALPHDCRLDETRADGSELHLAIVRAAESTERPSR